MSLTRQPVREGGSTATTAHLRGLLDLARVVRREPAPTEVLAAVAQMVARTLGYAAVAVNLYRPETDEYEVSTVYGNEDARRVLLGQVTPAESWGQMLDPRFLRRGVFFIPAGELAAEDAIPGYTPQRQPDPGAGESAWRPEDVLLVVLEGSAGRHYGVISVDEPESGRRPDDEQLEVLSAVAAHAALAIESAHRLAQLQEAMARHRA